MINLKRLIVPVLGMFLLFGCTTPQHCDDCDGGGAEAVCVISGEPADDGPTADFHGTTVNFCCKRCKAKWDKMDEATKQATLDKSK
ncbi:MAG TPA: hypothetical protein ENI87_05625 [bacterium]|nr:hypothetical protein [bacterium]